MKDSIRHSVRFVCFAAGFVLLLLISSKIFAPKNNAKESGIDDPNANGILSETEQTIDVLFLGDSECYSAFIPMQLWKKYGITSYNCGTAMQHLYYTEEFLHKAFERQSPKVVFLETNAIYRKSTATASAIQKAQRWFPVFQYHDRWKQLQWHDMTLSAAEYTNTVDAKGYIYHNGVSSASEKGYMTKSEKVRTVSSANRNYVIRFRDYCEKHGAKLILISTPSTRNWNMKRHNGIQKLADELKLEYYDLNLMKKDVPIDWERDTRDKGDHMNYSGAVKVTDWVGGYLSSAFQLENRKTDSRCESWNESLIRFREKVADHSA
ncbi:MAG: hypothetical protein IK118_01975 [Clostridia bacterium]|nr:hypothetical protein [Clostridia bacterium]